MKYAVTNFRFILPIWYFNKKNFFIVSINLLPKLLEKAALIKKAKKTRKPYHLGINLLSDKFNIFCN